jgi:outer membrane protein
MRFRRILIIVSIAMIVYMDGRAQVITGRPLTLQECVQLAVTNNLEVKQTNLDMERTGVNLKQAKANLLPNISGNVNHTLNQGRSIDLSTNSYVNQQNTSASYSADANLTLFNGLRLMNTLKSTQYAYEASKMDWQWGKDQLMLNVILAYLGILSNSDLLAVAQQQAAVTQKQVERLQVMNEQGAIKPSDLSDMQGLLADNKLNIINNQNNLDAARLRLSQLMNVPYNKNMQVERLSAEQFDMNYSATPDSIFQIALQQLAFVKAADLRKKSAAKAVSAARGNLYPSIGLGAGFYTPYSSTARDTADLKIKYYDQLSNNYRTYVGIGMSIPIFNNFRFRNQVALAKIDLKEAEYIAETRQVQLRQNIEQDHFNMTAALNKYRALIEQVAAYAESFRAAEARFNAGASTSVDYLISKNNLDRANVNLIIARYDYLLRTKILDFYQGKPLW